MKNHKTIVLPVLILTLIMVSAIHPQVAFADDETPSIENEVVQEEVEMPVETNDVTVLNENPQQISEPVTNTEETPLTLPDILEQTPTDTEIVVLNNSGEVEPFASQEAKNILATGDPMWCPFGQAPGDIGCTDSYDSFLNPDPFLGLLARLEADKAIFTGPGTIYIATNYNTPVVDTDDIEIDGSILDTLGALTILGGWDGALDGKATISGTSTLKGISLSVINWKDNVTIKNIFIDTSDYGLEVETDGNVALSDVVVTNTSASDGITIGAGGNVELTNVNSSLNRDNGAAIDSGGEIKIQNSSFSKNATGDGIYLSANSTITLNSVTASENAFNGASLKTSGDVSVSNSSFNDHTLGSYNVGIEITSPGSITLSSITTNNNDNGGIIIYASSDVILQDVTSQDNGWNGTYSEGKCVKVQVNGGTYSNNNGYGIEIYTGEAALSGTTFSNNTLGNLSQDLVDCISNESTQGTKKQSLFYTPYITLSWNNVSVIENSLHKLDCKSSLGTVFILESGDNIRVPCPIRGTVILNQAPVETLPNLIPSNYRYLSGMEFIVLSNGQPLDTLDAAVTLSYNDGNSSSVILYWDGSNWQELSSLSGQVGIVFGSNQQLSWDGNSWTGVIQSGTKYVGQFGHFSSDGFFEAILNFPGIFILAEKVN